MSPTTLSITNAGTVQVVELRPGIGQQEIPTHSIYPIDSDTRGDLIGRIDETVGFLHRFYRDESVAATTGGQSDPLRRLGRLIYGNLFSPEIQAGLAGLATSVPLVISTNDTQVPWELAHDGESYLGIRWSVGRQVRTPADQHPRRSVSPAGDRWKVLLVGNPTGDLPETTHEIEALEKLITEALPQADPLPLLRNRATKKRLREELASGEFRLIHYSGHAVLDKNGPDHSGLVLANGEIMTAQEIQNCLDGQPWVFLNACNSAAAASEFSAEQLSVSQGLATAFILGGAQAVIGTLWPVPDQGASRFSQALYRELLGGTPAGEALRRTRQRTLMENARNPVWSSYVLFGSPESSLVTSPRHEQLLATVLTLHFAGLAALQQQMSLEQVAETLEQLFAIFTIPIESKYGGEVISADRNRLVAIFGHRPVAVSGGERSSDDHPARAVRAALEIQDAQQRFHISMENRRVPGVACGLVTGTVLLDRSSGTLLGTTVDAAHWLAQHAQPDQILVDSSVVRTVRVRLDLAEWSEPIAVNIPDYLALDNVQVVRAIMSGVLDEFFGPLVGRSREKERLLAVWDEVRQGQGQIVDLTGVAGIGKSRFLHEFRQTLETQSARWILVRCFSHDQSIPYALVSALTRSLLASTAGENTTAWRQTAQRLLDQLGIPTSEARELANLLDALQSQTVDDNSLLIADPEAQLGQVVHALRLLLATILLEGPLAILIDDLHYVDELSGRVLERLIEGLDQYPLLLVAAYRQAEWQSTWFGRSFTTPLPLNDLDGAASTQLIHSHFQGALSDSIAKNIAEWAGGHPLQIVEIVRSLQEDGSLIRHNGNWVLTRVLSESKLPNTIQAVVQSRIQQLPPNVRVVVEAAATLGTEFTPALLKKVLRFHQEAKEIETSLSELTRRAFIRPGNWISSDHQFNHDLEHTAIYAGVALVRRREYHYQAAQAWQELSPDSKRASAQIAYHLYHSVTEEIEEGQSRVLLDQSRTALLVQTTEALIAAGNQARVSNLNQVAIDHYAKAQLIVDALQESSSRRWIECYEGWGEAASRLGEFTVALEKLEYAFGLLRRGRTSAAERRKAADMARRIGRIYMNQSQQQDALAWMEEGLRTLGVVPGRSDLLEDPADRAVAALLHIHTGSVHYWFGDYPAALEQGERGLQLAEDVDAQAAIAEGSNLVGVILDTQGQSRRALEYLRRSYGLYESLSDHYQLARVGDNFSTALFSLGEWGEARERDRKGLAFWRKIDDQHNTVFAALNIGLIHCYRGEWDEAEAHFDEGLRLSAEVGNHRMLALAHTNMGILRLNQARIDEGQEHLEQSLSLLQQYEIEDYLAETYCGLAEAALLSDNAIQAQEMATKALGIAEEGEMSAEQSIALRLLGLAYKVQGDLTQAEAHLRQSLTIAEEAEIVFEMARTSTELAMVCGETDRLAEAIDHSRQAIEIFERLQALPDLARARKVATWLQQTLK